MLLLYSNLWPREGAAFCCFSFRLRCALLIAMHAGINKHTLLFLIILVLG